MINVGLSQNMIVEKTNYEAASDGRPNYHVPDVEYYDRAHSYAEFLQTPPTCTVENMNPEGNLLGFTVERTGGYTREELEKIGNDYVDLVEDKGIFIWGDVIPGYFGEFAAPGMNTTIMVYMDESGSIFMESGSIKVSVGNGIEQLNLIDDAFGVTCTKTAGIPMPEATAVSTQFALTQESIPASGNERVAPNESSQVVIRIPDSLVYAALCSSFLVVTLATIAGSYVSKELRKVAKSKERSSGLKPIGIPVQKEEKKPSELSQTSRVSAPSKTTAVKDSDIPTTESASKYWGSMKNLSDCERRIISDNNILDARAKNAGKRVYKAEDHPKPR